MVRDLRDLPFEDLDLAEILDETVSCVDVVGLAEITGGRNPIHLSEHFAARTPSGMRIAHGIDAAGPISAVLGGAADAGSSARYSPAMRSPPGSAARPIRATRSPRRWLGSHRPSPATGTAARKTRKPKTCMARAPGSDHTLTARS